MFHWACIRGGEEIEVFPAFVEHGLGCFAQPVRDGVGFILLGVVDVDALEVRLGVQGVRDPSGVGGPSPADAPESARHVQGFLGDFLDFFGCDIHPTEVAAVVCEGEFLAVRRPCQGIVETGTAQLDRSRFSFSVLRLDDERVLSRRVGEIGDGFSIRRPGWVALVGCRRLGQVSRVSLFFRHGDDLSPEFEYGPGSGGRDGGIPYKPRSVDVPGTEF